MANKVSGGIVPKVLNILVGVAGLLMLVVGITMYAVTSAQLVDQKVTVADYDHALPSPNGWNAGKTVAGPFTALAQIQAIAKHMSASGESAGWDGFTYGTAPSVSLKADGTCNSAVNFDLSKVASGKTGTFTCDAGQKPVLTGDLLTADQAAASSKGSSYVVGSTLAGLRSSLMNGSFLIASLYVSILAFGVSFMAAGIGIVFLLLAAINFLRMQKKAEAATE